MDESRDTCKELPFTSSFHMLWYANMAEGCDRSFNVTVSGRWIPENHSTKVGVYPTHGLEFEYNGTIIMPCEDLGLEVSGASVNHAYTCQCSEDCWVNIMLVYSCGLEHHMLKAAICDISFESAARSYGSI